MNENQENQSWGGKREGAGRPLGSVKRPQIVDYITAEEVDKLTNKAYTMAEQGNETMLKFILEQVYGRAKQALEMSGEGGLPFQIIITRDEHQGS